MKPSLSEGSEHEGLAPWKISENEFPVQGTPVDKLKFFLEFAILAPSSHNTQPWTFRISDNNTIHLYSDRIRALPVVDPDDRELTISCGSALFNLQLAVSYFGYKFETSLLPREEESDHDLLAAVKVTDIDEKLEKTKDEGLKRLFNSITHRRTNRFRFDEKEISEEILSNLQFIAQKYENVWFHIEKKKKEKEQLAKLVTEGDLIQMSDKKFRRELASWIHTNRSHLMDGMPGYAFGFGDIMSLVGPFVIRTFDFGKGQAAKDKELAIGSPVLLVIGTNADNTISWLNAGLSLSNMLLYLKTENLWCSYLNQPIEVPHLRKRLGSLIPGHSDTNPQLLLRLGYSNREVLPTPRRSIEQVMIREEDSHT
ncbi:Acg family FMN-binding oxidoreductase [Candidatus Nitrosocosmicus arcticus]|uniref:Nitroreductase-like protein n=1 Tax=Candidatus Nitrosocosmicus arcticus TaxID=2035267 RepID=A0A557SVZ5_9ARCH|nr:nitroreductase family protein [Candidatus Nitrosocosmicus arcticus]TVP40763.1 nitroreductase-like protein [Candidatus Nitrosocosmicus arcticus]